MTEDIVLWYGDVSSTDLVLEFFESGRFFSILYCGNDESERRRIKNFYRQIRSRFRGVDHEFDFCCVGVEGMEFDQIDALLVGVLNTVLKLDRPILHCRISREEMDGERMESTLRIAREYADIRIHDDKPQQLMVEHIGELYDYCRG